MLFSEALTVKEIQVKVTLSFNKVTLNAPKFDVKVSGGVRGYS